MQWHLKLYISIEVIRVLFEITECRSWTAFANDSKWQYHFPSPSSSLSCSLQNVTSYQYEKVSVMVWLMNLTRDSKEGKSAWCHSLSYTGGTYCSICYDFSYSFFSESVRLFSVKSLASVSKPWIRCGVILSVILFVSFSHISNIAVPNKKEINKEKNEKRVN